MSLETLDRAFLGSNVQLANPVDDSRMIKQIAGYVIAAASSTWLVGDAAAIDSSSPWWQGLLINDASHRFPGGSYADPHALSHQPIATVSNELLPAVGNRDSWPEAALPQQNPALGQGELDISLLYVDFGSGVTSNVGASGLIIATEAHYLNTGHYLTWTSGAEQEMAGVSYLVERPGALSSPAKELPQLRIGDQHHAYADRVLPAVHGRDTVAEDEWLKPDFPLQRKKTQATVAESIDDSDDEPKWISLQDLSYEGGGLMRKRRRS